MSATYANKGIRHVCMKTEPKRTKREHCDDKGKESEKFSKERESSESEQTGATLSEATSHRVIQDTYSTHTSSVMPDWLSTTSNPETEVVLYALLDNQSDTTFVLQEKADIMDTQKESVQLKLPC